MLREQRAMPLEFVTALILMVPDLWYHLKVTGSPTTGLPDELTTFTRALTLVPRVGDLVDSVVLMPALPAFKIGVCMYHVEFAATWLLDTAFAVSGSFSMVPADSMTFQWDATPL